MRGLQCSPPPTQACTSRLGGQNKHELRWDGTGGGAWEVHGRCTGVPVARHTSHCRHYGQQIQRTHYRGEDAPAPHSTPNGQGGGAVGFVHRRGHTTIIACIVGRACAMVGHSIYWTLTPTTAAMKQCAWWCREKEDMVLHNEYTALGVREARRQMRFTR